LLGYLPAGPTGVVSRGIRQFRAVGSEYALAPWAKNLTRNALRAVAEEGSTVTLFARAEGEWAIAGVADDRPGMPADEIGRVFDRFYRRRATRDRQRGSGLGP